MKNKKRFIQNQLEKLATNILKKDEKYQGLKNIKLKKKDGNKSSN